MTSLPRGECSTTVMQHLKHSFFVVIPVRNSIRFEIVSVEVHRGQEPAVGRVAVRLDQPPS